MICFWVDSNIAIEPRLIRSRYFDRLRYLLQALHQLGEVFLPVHLVFDEGGAASPSADQPSCLYAYRLLDHHIAIPQQAA